MSMSKLKNGDRIFQVQSQIYKLCFLVNSAANDVTENALESLEIVFAKKYIGVWYIPAGTAILYNDKGLEDM